MRGGRGGGGRQVHRGNDLSYALDITLEEAAKGAPNLKAKREALGQHPVEIVGAKIRSLFERN